MASPTHVKAATHAKDVGGKVGVGLGGAGVKLGSPPTAYARGALNILLGQLCSSFHSWSPPIARCFRACQPLAGFNFPYTSQDTPIVTSQYSVGWRLSDPTNDQSHQKSHW